MTSPWTARILTLFPQMFPGPLGLSLAGKAHEGKQPNYPYRRDYIYTT